VIAGIPVSMDSTVMTKRGSVNATISISDSSISVKRESAYPSIPVTAAHVSASHDELEDSTLIELWLATTLHSHRLLGLRVRNKSETAAGENYLNLNFSLL
jgi:hypothetical protein